MASKTTALGSVASLLTRPRLLPAVVRAAWRFRARGWWRRPPFLPLPPRSYMEWRLHTAYGDEGRAPTGGEIARYLEWADRMHRTRRSGVRRR